MGLSEIIQIVIYVIKIAIPTVVFFLGVAVLRMNQKSWESFVGRLVGVGDLEVSIGSFIALKAFGSLLIIGAFGLGYWLLAS